MKCIICGKLLLKDEMGCEMCYACMCNYSDYLCEYYEEEE